jgi:hypothetical protein
VVAAFGGHDLLEQGRRFIEGRGVVSGDMFVIHLTGLEQADALVMLVQLLGAAGDHAGVLAAPTADSLHRFLRGHAIGIPDQTIVEARLDGRLLTLTDAELGRHIIETDKVRPLKAMEDSELAAFTIHSNGRYLSWSDGEVEMTLQGLRQASDESYRALTGVEDLKRAAGYGRALRRVRERHQVRQNDVPGLSERQLRRLETGVSPPSLDAMQALADRLRMPMNELLQHVAEERTRVEE